jgi:hypothetical protein
MLCHLDPRTLEMHIWLLKLGQSFNKSTLSKCIPQYLTPLTKLLKCTVIPLKLHYCFTLVQQVTNIAIRYIIKLQNTLTYGQKICLNETLGHDVCWHGSPWCLNGHWFWNTGHDIGTIFHIRYRLIKGDWKITKKERKKPSMSG